MKRRIALCIAVSLCAGVYTTSPALKSVIRNLLSSLWWHLQATVIHGKASSPILQIGLEAFH